MAAVDATPFPVKNQAFRVTFPILDNTGSLVPGAVGLDSEVSKDAGIFADVTAEATEIATSSGVYYLDLTATEMNADTVTIIIKTTTTDAKTTTLILYPQANGLDRKVDVTHWNGAAIAVPTTAGVPKVDTTHISGTVQTANDNGADINTLIANQGNWLTATGFSTHSAADIWTVATRALTDKTGFSLSTAGILAIWHQLTSAVVTVGSVGKLIVDNIDATISSRNSVVPDAAGVAATPAEVAQALVDIHLDHLLAVDYDPATPPGVATALLNEIIESDAGISRFTVNALENAPSGTGASAAVIADAVWDELQAGHVLAGSFGLYLDTEVSGIAGGSGLTAQQTRDAMKLAPTVGAPAAESLDEKLDNVELDTAGLNGDAMRGTDGANTTTPLNAAGIRSALGMAAADMDTQLDAILAIIATSGVEINAAQMNQIADHILKRGAAAARASADGDTASFRSLLGGVNKLTNKVAVVGTNLATYEEDDLTTIGIQALVTDAAAEPIISMDTT